MDMIPSGHKLLMTDFEQKVIPSKAHKLNTATGSMTGFIDDIEAVKQAVYLILNTERYDHVIYSWNYGGELAGLLGKPLSFVLPEIKRRITEALLQDDRIESVDKFEFEIQKGVVHAAFLVATVFGEISVEKAVNI